MIRGKTVVIDSRGKTVLIDYYSGVINLLLYLYTLLCNSVFYHPYSVSGMAFILVLCNRTW